MNQQEALTVLVNAAKLGQQRGIWSLDEAKLIAEAVEIFTVSEQESNEIQEAPAENEVTHEGDSLESMVEEAPVEAPVEAPQVEIKAEAPPVLTEQPQTNDQLVGQKVGQG